MSKPEISVIISTKDRARLLRRTLQSIREQDYNVEIVVGDDGSDDDTRHVCEEHGATWFLTGKTVYDNCGGATAINMAFARCSGRIIVQQNAEVVHAPGCLAELVAALGHDDGRAVFATVYDVPEAFLDHRPDYTRNYVQGLGTLYCGRARPVPWFFLGATTRGGFMWYRSDLPGAADVELGTRMAIAGYKFVWCDSAVAYHLSHPPVMRGVCPEHIFPHVARPPWESNG